MRKSIWILVFALVLSVASHGNAVVSVSKGAGSLIDANGIPIDTPTGESGDIALSVHDEHLHQTPWFHPATRDDTAVDTLNGAVAANSKTLILNDATGFSVGDYINIDLGAVHTHMYRKITAIVTNTLTIDASVDFALTDGSTVQEVILNMAVDGSSTPVIFEVNPSVGENIDIMRLLIQITDATEPDDSKFGAEPALTNGVLLRKSINNGASYETLAIWRTNGDMKLDMFNVEYSSKAGAGNWGVSGRWTIFESGAVLNIEEANNEKLEIIVQDDLTGLVTFEIKFQGHFE